MKASSFPVLVWGLAEKHHSGALLLMAIHAKLPQSTLWRWARGLPTKYAPELVRRLCEAYDLKFADTWELIQQDEAARLGGKKIPLPDLSGIKRGPVPYADRHKRRRNITRALTGVALLGAMAATPAVGATATSTTSTAVETEDYVNRRRCARRSRRLPVVA